MDESAHPTGRTIGLEQQQTPAALERRGLPDARLFKLRQHLVRTLDRACDELREEREIRGEREEVARGLAERRNDMRMFAIAERIDLNVRMTVTRPYSAK